MICTVSVTTKEFKKRKLAKDSIRGMHTHPRDAYASEGCIPGIAGGSVFMNTSSAHSELHAGLQAITHSK